MATPDNKQKLLALFADIIEVRRPDPLQALKTPAKDLEEGRQKVAALLDAAVRPNRDELVPRAAGRQRFPELQGTVGLFAEGLAKNADLVAEIFADPEVCTTAVAFDQAIGRFVYGSELLTQGGQTGEVLCAAAAQKLCQDTLSEARARIEDPTVPAQTQSDLSVAFAEAFRLEKDNLTRQQKARSIGEQAEQPYLHTLDQTRANVTLFEAVETYLKSLKPEGVQP